MGRNLSWRKIVIILNLLIIIVYINSEPIASKKNRPLWKDSISSNNLELKESKNNYKHIKINNFVNNDTIKMEALFKSLTQVGWEKYLNTTFNRLLPYRDFIAKEIETQGVPTQLLYLPIIESAAHPLAVSYRGATGLWQFMSNSSGAYNMKTTEWVDERRDFVKSTKGAISKLKYNYNVTGDWLLAIAAYNCGLNRVQTVVRNSGISDYWELSNKGLLPKETINYIPKLLLVSYLIQNKNEFNLPIKWDKKEWTEVSLTSAVDLRMLSQKANIPLEIIKSGNSELNYNVTPPINSEYKLKIPSEYTDTLVEALSTQDNLMEFYRYKVKSGDTLSEIGYYYGISTPSLISYNPGISARNLRVGKTLIVPAVKKVKPYGSEIVTEQFKNDYIVLDGDTLWDISIKYNTTVEEIALNSGLRVDSYIKKGMRLKVP